MIFTTDFLHLLIYIFNVTFSATLRYFNLLPFTNFSFHYFICILNITFYPTLTHSNIFLFTTACFTPLWYVCIKIWIGVVTCISTCSGCLIHKKDFFWRSLGCTLLFFVSVLFFSVQSFNFCCTLLPLLIFFLHLAKYFFHPYIIHTEDWPLVAWSQNIYSATLYCIIISNLNVIFVPPRSHYILFKWQFTLWNLNEWFNDIKWLHFLKMKVIYICITQLLQTSIDP